MSSGNIKKFEVRLGRTGMIITVAGMALLLCGSFILGVAVGKNINTYPERIASTPQRVVAFFWRPAKVAGPQSVAEPRDANVDQGNIDLAFHNTLTNSKTLPIQPQPKVEKKADKEVLFDQRVVVPAASPEETPKQESTINKETAAVEKATQEKSVGEKKVDKKTETASASQGLSYFIHVASLKDKNKADQINKTVVNLGYRSKVVRTDIKGKGIWYRVIATGFDTKAQAKAAVVKISKKVKTTCIIRQTGTDMDKG